MIPHDEKKPPNDAVEKLAWWLDEAFPLPGTKWRVGLDPLLGLIPGVGDLMTTMAQALIVILAATRPPYLPKAVIARMALNVFLDSAIGAIPLVGNLFDFFFRASTRNRLLIQRVREAQRRGQVSSAPHIAYVTLILLVFLSMIGALAYLTFRLVVFFGEYLSQQNW